MDILRFGVKLLREMKWEVSDHFSCFGIHEILIEAL